jgi:hypothetical protein
MMSTATNDEPQVPGSILDAQVQRLLDIVQGYQQQQCDALLSQAQQESQDIVRQAYRLASRNIHADIQLTRQHIRDTMAAARAKQHTLMMQQSHSAATSFLEQCWQALQPSLNARWQQLDCRRQWVDNILATATAVLPVGDWMIEHPADFSAAEQQQLVDQTQALAGVEPRLNSAADLSAGIRISADGASVDGSLDGLLSDRSSLEALLLASAAGKGRNHE